MSPPTNSGIRTTEDGTAFIPASKRADGTTRKALRVRPGFTPQEDVETYKSRNAEAWKHRGTGGVPGTDELSQSDATGETRSKNAKRREAAKKRRLAEQEETNDSGLAGDIQNVLIISNDSETKDEQDLSIKRANDEGAVDNEQQQKKVRNVLKKLSGIKELKEKRSSGEKLSPDQLMKLGREQELLRDLKKLGYDIDAVVTQETTGQEQHNPS